MSRNYADIYPTAQPSPWFFLGRLSMALALEVRDGAKDSSKALEEYMTSEAITEEHRERLRKVLKK